MAHLYDRPTVEISMLIPGQFTDAGHTNQFDSLGLENPDLAADLQTFPETGKERAILTVSEAMTKKSKAIFYFKHGADEATNGPGGAMYVLELGKILADWKKSNHPAADTGKATEGRPATPAGGDGSAYAKAVVIVAKDEEAGVAAERAWLEQRYPGFDKGRQSLLDHDGKKYDLIDITTTAGEHKTLYFDITGFFGKMNHRNKLDD